MDDFLVIGHGSQGKLIVDMLNSVQKNMDIVIAEHHTDIGTDIDRGIVAIGDNHIRHKIVQYVLQQMPEFHFKWATHPTVIAGRNVKVGKGTMTMTGAIINSDTQIGEHCLINTGAIIEHDNIIGNFVNIQPGVVTGGCVEIGDFTQIGMGAVIRDHIKIGKNCIIGMGSIVLNDVPNNTTVWGNPAKTQTGYLKIN